MPCKEFCRNTLFLLAEKGRFQQNMPLGAVLAWYPDRAIPLPWNGKKIAAREGRPGASGYDGRSLDNRNRPGMVIFPRLRSISWKSAHTG